jgi:hypothetical protein
MAAPVVRHARRFGAAYFALAAMLGAAIGFFIVLVERPAPVPPPPWSAWQPESEAPIAQVTEIADHVAAQYHLKSGHRLVSVLVGSPDSSDQQIRAVAIAKRQNATQRDDYDFVDANSTAMFILCGDRKLNCAIKEGQPTQARHALLRREALELALYTFRYVSDTDFVVAFLPPRKGRKNLTDALFFRKGDLAEQLSEPLVRTLPKARAPLPDKLTKRERRRIDNLTLARFFTFNLTTTQDGARLLVLEVPPAN